MIGGINTSCAVALFDPHRIHTPPPITKKLLLIIKSATPTAEPNLVQIRPRGASGQMDEIKEIFLFIPFFHELTYRSDPPTDFHAWWLKRRGFAQGCAFWGFRWHCFPFWGWGYADMRLGGCENFVGKWEQLVFNVVSLSLTSAETEGWEWCDWIWQLWEQHVVKESSWCVTNKAKINSAWWVINGGVRQKYEKELSDNRRWKIRYSMVD